LRGTRRWELGVRRWEMGDGRWEMGDGRWEMGDGRWEMGRINPTNRVKVLQIDETIVIL
jgi:hypothetical protein